MYFYFRYICKENYGNPEFDWMYSQILMLLQYIIPAAVLLFTYTRIGIVIWCHRIPGEAENSRDQRIARSKIKVRTSPSLIENIPKIVLSGNGTAAPFENVAEILYTLQISIRARYLVCSYSSKR